MKKLKSCGKKPQVSTNPRPEQMLSFSFCHLTTNKSYNFQKLDRGAKKEWQSALAERIIEITQDPWLYHFNLGKKQGIETLPNSHIKFSPNEYTFSEDEKVIVFRFNSEKGRIIGIRKDDSPIFYVIGFDVDFSAYKHD